MNEDKSIEQAPQTEPFTDRQTILGCLGSAIVGSALAYPFCKGLQAVNRLWVEHPTVSTPVIAVGGALTTVAVGIRELRAKLPE